jgi:RNA polymerase sigma factor (sigma-70 family)
MVRSRHATWRSLKPQPIFGQGLHRYCSRMTGSVLDGEDIVQEALFQAYRKREMFDDGRPLAPWLFRIAHNQCIDFLRCRKVRGEADTAAVVPDRVMPVDPPGPDLGRAVEQLVLTLPPKERACVLLKDVFEYSLEEIAGLVDSTIGGVKATLKRGPLKLASLPERRAPSTGVVHHVHQAATRPSSFQPVVETSVHLYQFTHMCFSFSPLAMHAPFPRPTP